MNVKKIIIFFICLILPLLYFIYRQNYPAKYFISPNLPVSLIPTSTPKPQIVSLGLVGDLGLGRHITSTARNKDNFNWSFEAISSWLLQNDFNLSNLESPIIINCPEGKTGTFTFCGDTRFLPYLRQNNFIFNLANNHIFNYGQSGFNQTTEFLSDYSLPFFYSHQPDTEFTSKTINDISFGFLGFDLITNPNLDSQKIIDLIKKYDSSVDWLLVSIHWGNEYLPTAESWRINLAHLMVDAGADIIHGHHPHVWQDYEIYQDKPIFYSFGNFIFDQSWSYPTSHSQISRLILSKEKVVNIDFFPIEINFNFQPALMFKAPASGAH